MNLQNCFTISALMFCLAGTEIHNAAEQETIIVSASRIEMPISASLNDVLVISRDDIEISQADSLVELLSASAGLDLIRKGGAGQESSIFIRGANANHLLIVIDGVRVGSATLGLKALSDISLAQIESIEIIKGPRAALWGSQAIGGVLQIFTRQQDHQSIQITTGSSGYKGLVYGAGFKSQALNGSITYQQTKLSGIDTRFDLDPDTDGAKREHFNLNGSYLIDPNQTLKLLIQNDQGNTEFDTAWGGDQLDFNNQIYSLSYLWNNNNWQHQIQLNQHQDSSITHGQSTLPVTFETSSQSVTWLIENKPSDHWTIGTSLEWQRDDIGNSDTLYNQSERNTLAAHLYSHYQSQDWINELAIRHTNMDGLASNNAIHFGLGYRFSAQQLLSINFGEGFKAPTFNDLYFPFGGNENLNHETSDNLEIVYKQSFDIGQLSLTIFDNDIKNLIQWIPDSQGVWAPQNVGESNQQGIDLSVQWQALEMQHKLTAGYVDAVDLNTQTKLQLRASEQAAYQVSGFIDKAKHWSTLVQVKYVGKRPDVDYQSYLPIEHQSYIQTDLAVQYDFNNNWRLGLRVNDIFNNQGIYVSGFRPEGRSFRLSLNYLGN